MASMSFQLHFWGLRGCWHLVQVQSYRLCCCPRGLGHHPGLSQDVLCPCLQGTAGSQKQGHQSNSTWPLPNYFTISMWDFPPCYLKSWKYLQEKEEYPIITWILDWFLSIQGRNFILLWSLWRVTFQIDLSWFQMRF